MGLKKKKINFKDKYNIFNRLGTKKKCKANFRDENNILASKIKTHMCIFEVGQVSKAAPSLYPLQVAVRDLRGGKKENKKDNLFIIGQQNN